MSRLSGRIALVAGASRGLGYALALRYAAEGAHVILVARTQGGLEEADDAIRAKGGSATLVPLDLRQGDAVDQLGAVLFERFRRLDVMAVPIGVLHNLSPVSHLTAKDFDEMLQANLVVPWRLIRAMEPLLRASDSGRAIFVTCDAALERRAYWAGYAAAKAGLEALVLGWAAEHRNGPLRINLVDPGPMATGIRFRAFPGESKAILPAPADRTGAFVDLAAADCRRHGERVSAVS